MNGNSRFGRQLEHDATREINRHLIPIRKTGGVLICFLILIGLIGIGALPVIFGQERKPVIHDDKTKVHTMVLTKGVIINDPHPHTRLKFEQLNQFQLVGGNPIPDRNISADRMVLSKDNRIRRWLVVNVGREINKWLGENFYPCLISQIVGWSHSAIKDIEHNPWGSTWDHKRVYEHFQRISIGINSYLRPLPLNHGLGLCLHNRSLSSHQVRLVLNRPKGANRDYYSSNCYDDQGNIWKVLRRKQAREVAFRMIGGPIAILIGTMLIYYVNDARGLCGLSVFDPGAVSCFLAAVVALCCCPFIGRTSANPMKKIFQGISVAAHFRKIALSANYQR